MDTEQHVNQWRQVIAKASQDGEFRKRLIAAPARVVKECGLEMQAGVQLRVIENTDQVLHLLLPPLQSDKELSDAELDVAVGGLVVNAIIYVPPIKPMLPPEGDLSRDQAQQLLAGNPLPRPR